MPAPIPDLSSDQQCHHYQAPTGQRCGSPALKGEYYCYHHHIKHTDRNNRRVLIDPEITCMEIPPIEDRTSIFIALAAVIHRLAENTIDTRRAGQMIYGLQVAMRALEPPPVHRCRTSPAAESVPEPQPTAEASSNTDSASCTHAAVRLATNNQQLATAPRTIPITKESLLYFLRSRHCYNCNAELFPAEELTQRRNAGAPPKIIEEHGRALPAPPPATDNLQPATVLSTLHAVAEESPDPAHRLQPTTCNLQLTNGAEPPPQSTFTARFALHSPRRSVSLRLARRARRSLGCRHRGPHPNSHQKINRRTKWQL